MGVPSCILISDSVLLYIWSSYGIYHRRSLSLDLLLESFEAIHRRGGVRVDSSFFYFTPISDKISKNRQNFATIKEQIFGN